MAICPNSWEVGSLVGRRLGYQINVKPNNYGTTSKKKTKAVRMNQLQYHNVPSYTSFQEAGSHTLDTS